MMRSMLADHPYSDVVKTQGESAIRELIKTFSTLSPKTSFMSLLSGSNSAFNSSNFFFSSSSSMSKPSFVTDFNFLPSNSFSCWTAYSSIIDEVAALRDQNEELKGLLNQYLS